MSKQRTKPTRTQAFLAISIVLCLVVGATIQWISNSPKSTFTPDPGERAWVFCTNFIEKQFGVLVQEADRHRRGSIIFLAAGQYQVDVVYPKQNNTYRCEVLGPANKLMKLLSLVEMPPDPDTSARRDERKIVEPGKFPIDHLDRLK